MKFTQDRIFYWPKFTWRMSLIRDSIIRVRDWTTLSRKNGYLETRKLSHTDAAVIRHRAAGIESTGMSVFQNGTTATFINQPRQRV